MHRLISRDETGLPAPKAALQSTNLLKDTFFFHHTVTPVSDNPFADLRRVTNYSKYVDIPYNVLTHPKLVGDLLMGRFLNGVPALGAHTGGNNTKGHGLARIGNYMTGELTDELLESEVFAILLFIENGWLKKEFNLIGHRAAPGQSTACPGTVFFNKLTHINEIVRGRGFNLNVKPLPVIQTPQQPLSSAPAYPMLLLKGTKGNYVKQVQNQLLALGYKLPKYGADSSFGDETLKAVKAFQKDHPPLDVDGKVGKNTWKALFATTPAGQPGPTTLFVGFPLPDGHYYGKFKERNANHSGYFANDRPAIRMIQQKLGLTADGGFGNDTHNAVVAYQTRVGLPADGLVGVNTWKRLFS